MISKFLNKSELKKLKLGHLGKNCQISNKTSFIGNQNIFIGDNSRIDDYTILVAHDGSIKIGANTHIGSLTYILGSGVVVIGNSCNISQGVKIYSKSDNYKIKKKKTFKEKVKISNNCIIGSNSVILPGSKLGNNVRVGALTLVNKEIKSNRLFFGNKIKMIKE